MKREGHAHTKDMVKLYYTSYIPTRMSRPFCKECPFASYWRCPLSFRNHHMKQLNMPRMYERFMTRNPQGGSCLLCLIASYDITPSV